MAALKSGPGPASKSAAAWLIAMCKTTADLRATVLLLFDTVDGPGRLALMQAVYVDHDLPTRFLTAFLRRALVDADPLVRSLAGTAIQYGEHRTLLPALVRAAAHDPDPATAESLAENVAFLRVGYVVKPIPRKRYEVRVAIGVGTQRIEVPARVVDAIGFGEIVRRLRLRRAHEGRRPKGNWWDLI